MKESAIERKLVSEIKKAGGMCIKLPAALYRGIPDRMVLLPGARIIFVELKTDTGRVSQAQENFLSILSKLGFKSDIIKGQSGLKRFLNENLS